jgi:hypothetical protein
LRQNYAGDQACVGLEKYAAWPLSVAWRFTSQNRREIMAIKQWVRFYYCRSQKSRLWLEW